MIDLEEQNFLLSKPALNARSFLPLLEASSCDADPGGGLVGFGGAVGVLQFLSWPFGFAVEGSKVG